MRDRETMPWRWMWLTLALLVVAVPLQAATPTVNSAVTKTRIFNDCPTSTVTVTNSYPSLIELHDSNLSCSGFANLHNWRLSGDGTTAAQFDNDSTFRVAADLVLDGTSASEAGLNIAPWWSLDADGRFNVSLATAGEVAVFGGRLPFFTFTGSFGLHYVAGQTIHLAMIYRPNGLSAVSPATVEYRVRYQGVDYTSGALAFDEGNLAENPPHGLWGILTPAEVGGFLMAHLTSGVASDARAVFTNVFFGAPDQSEFEAVPAAGQAGLAVLALAVALAGAALLFHRRG